MRKPLKKVRNVFHTIVEVDFDNEVDGSHIRMVAVVGNGKSSSLCSSRHIHRIWECHIQIES